MWVRGGRIWCPADPWPGVGGAWSGMWRAVVGGAVAWPAPTQAPRVPPRNCYRTAWRGDRTLAARPRERRGEEVHKDVRLGRSREARRGGAAGRHAQWEPPSEVRKTEEGGRLSPPSPPRPHGARGRPSLSTDEGGRGARAPDRPPERAGQSRNRGRRSTTRPEGGGLRIRLLQPPSSSFCRAAWSNGRGEGGGDRSGPSSARRAAGSRGRAPPAGGGWPPASAPPGAVSELHLGARRRGGSAGVGAG